MPDAAARTTGGDALAREYRGLVRRRALLVGLLALLVAASVIGDILTGASGLGIGDVATILLSGPGEDIRGVIVWDVRLPYALMAVLVGAALGLAGAEMQTVLHNPLASPFTLGVSSAAALGAGLAIVLGSGLPAIPQDWLITANAFVFSLGAMLLLQVMSRLRGAGVDTLVLFGIALVFAFNALVALLQYIATEQALQQLVFWTMGSLARTSWGKVALLAAVIAACLPFLVRAAWALTALRLGEDRARAFGIDPARIRRGALLRVALLASVSVASVGTIGFIGLVGPHAARLLVGEDHRFFLPAAALCGALLLSISSVAAKTIVPGVLLPVGIVTAIIGVPAFVALIFTRSGRA